MHASRPEITESQTGTGTNRSAGCAPAAEMIRIRAYELSQTRNGGPGDAQTDWVQAERELAAANDEQG